MTVSAYRRAGPLREAKGGKTVEFYAPAFEPASPYGDALGDHPRGLRRYERLSGLQNPATDHARAGASTPQQSLEHAYHARTPSCPLDSLHLRRHRPGHLRAPKCHEKTGPRES